MRMLASCALAVACLCGADACKKQDDSAPPAAAPSASAVSGAYPPPPATLQPPPAVPSAPSAAAPPTTAPATGSATMAVPGPLAFQCQNDVPCGTHHCNVTYAKCAFPCQSNVDCISPNNCVLGLCVPAGLNPGTH